jgi:sugar O-acyltransferase (sialic acid O-acetyltransferase NeuD family)
LSEPVRALGLGAGGHTKVVLEILVAAGGIDVVGLLDPRRDLWETTVLGVRVLGDDSLLPVHYHAGVSHVFIGLGSASDTRPRRRLYEYAAEQGFDVVAAVHPSASVSPSARIGRGATILAGAVVNADSELGDDVIVNTNAVVEHDCRVGSHVHVASGAVVASGVRIGNGVHVGAGATVIQGVEIGDGAVVGAGAVVLGDVESGTIVVGVPARVLRRVES